RLLVGGGRRPGPPVRSHARIVDQPRWSPAVGDLQVLDAVDPPRPEPLRFAHFGDVGDLVGDLVEHQPDLHAGQVGADAVVRAVAAEAQMRVGVAQDVEAERVVEHVLVVVGRTVEQPGALTRLDRYAADLGVDDGR